MTNEATAAFFRSVVTPRQRERPRLSETLRAVEARRIATPHGTVTAWRIGDGPATLLVHGWEDDNSLWGPMIATLVDRSQAVVVFDLPAHGYSDGESGLGFEAADAARAVAEALGPIDAIVAHSMGAGAAGLAISEGLAVRGCVLIAPPLVGGNRWRRLADRMGVSMETADHAQAIYEARIGPQRVTGFDLRGLLPELATRVLVVHSADDERMPFRASHEISAASANVELLQVEGLRHRATAQDAGVTSRVADFIERA
jgi:pimeloyl-ACP methyl ester carboxylesterase